MSTFSNPLCLSLPTAFHPALFHLVPLHLFPPSRLRPRLALIPHNCMQHDLIHPSGHIRRIPFTPIITDTIRKDPARTVEIRRADGAAHLRVPLQPMLGVLVPEMEGAVAAGGAEGAVLRVEGDGIDAVDICVVVARGAGGGGARARARRGDGGAVAFEGEVCGGVFILDVLDGAAAFDAADGETRAVVEAGDDAGLPFQGGLDGLVEFARFAEVDDVDVAVRGGDDEEGADDVEGVDAFLAGDRGDGVRGAEVPVFDGFVPGARDEHLGLLGGDVDEAGAADRGVVGGDLGGRCSVAGGEVEHSGGFVTAGSDDFSSILPSPPSRSAYESRLRGA